MAHASLQSPNIYTGDLFAVCDALSGQLISPEATEQEGEYFDLVIGYFMDRKADLPPLPPCLTHLASKVITALSDEGVIGQAGAQLCLQILGIPNGDPLPFTSPQPAYDRQIYQELPFTDAA